MRVDHHARYAKIYQERRRRMLVAMVDVEASTVTFLTDGKHPLHRLAVKMTRTNFRRMQFDTVCGEWAYNVWKLLDVPESPTCWEVITCTP